MVLVTTVAEAPLAGNVKVTVAPSIASPLLSVSWTASVRGNAVPTAVCMASRPAIDSTLAPRFVRRNRPLSTTPTMAAVTSYVPMVALAVTVIDARPLLSVMAVLAESVALAPLAGAANVTVTPLNGLPATSATATTSALANAAEAGAPCGVPLTTKTVAGSLGRFSISNRTAARLPVVALALHLPAVVLAVAVIVA